MQPIWFLAAIFMATCGALYVAAESGSRRRRRVYERLSRLQWDVHKPLEVTAEVTATMPSRDLLPGVSRVLERGGVGERLKWRLTQAGFSLRPYEFLLGTALMGVVGFTVGVALRDRVLAGALAVLGAALPPVVLSVLRSQRLAQFSGQLPDALVLIASSIRSGYSFLRAIQVAAAELPDPMRQELQRSVREAEIGFPLVVALQNMVRRVPNYDLELTVTAVSIQMQVGGNLAEILDTIAQTIRERVRTRRQIAALTAEGRLSGVIAFAMPWAMFVLIKFLNPQYMKPLVTEPLGLVMIGAGVTLQLLGGFWISRLLAMDL
jgi:tight adherence protein B